MKLYLFCTWCHSHFQEIHERNHPGVALSEEGQEIGHHVSSNHSFLTHDLLNKDKVKEFIKEHKCEVEFVDSNQLLSHSGLEKAIQLHNNKIELGQLS